MAGRVLRASENPRNQVVAELRQWLVKNGCATCDVNGIAEGEEDESLRNLCTAFDVSLGEAVGVLAVDPTIKARTGLFGWFGPRRRRWVGTLWLDNEVRRANASKWVFEVHGSVAEPMAEALATKLAWSFKVDIQLNVIDDCQYEVMGAHELP